MKQYNRSLGQNVFWEVREGILLGKYKKEEELRETAIGKAMGVSRTPVREAMRQLELEGLVNIIPNKGAYVVGLSTQDMQDIYEMRFLLEGMCARRAALSISENQLEKLEEVIYLSEFHLRREHIEQVAELDGIFHTFIYESCGSKMLEHALGDYLYYLKQVRKAGLACSGRAIRSIEEHRSILNAIKAHDGDLAEKAAGLHIRNTINNIKDYGWDKIITENGGHENGKD